MSAVLWVALGAFIALVAVGIFSSLASRGKTPDNERLDFVNDNSLVLMRGFGMWVVMHDGGNGPLLPVSRPHPTVRAAIDAVMIDGIVPVVLPDAA
jgi:hypothetical protein